MNLLNEEKVFTFCCLDNADFQTLKRFARELLQRAQRRGGSGDPVPRRVGARHFLQHSGRTDTRNRLLYRGFVQNILDAERR